MAPKNRWEYILEKAHQETNADRSRLCLGWAEAAKIAHQDRHIQELEDTQRLAEVRWWGQLFPGQPFPEDWKPEDDGKNDGSQDWTLINSNTYKSCWVGIKEEAVRRGIPVEDFMDGYLKRLDFCINPYLIKYGQAVHQFRTELLTWRDFFPDDVFIGIDPQTGAQNLNTSHDVRKANEAIKLEQAREKEEAVGSNQGVEKTEGHEEDAWPSSNHIQSEDNVTSGHQQPPDNFSFGLLPRVDGLPRTPNESFDEAQPVEKYGSEHYKEHQDPENHHQGSREHTRANDDPTELENYDREDEERGRSDYRHLQDPTAKSLDTTGGLGSAFDESRSLSRRSRPRCSRDTFDANADLRAANPALDESYRDNDYRSPTRDIFDDEYGYPERGRGSYRGRARGRGRGRASFRGRGEYRGRRSEYRGRGGGYKGRGGDYRARSRSPAPYDEPREYRDRSMLRSDRRAEQATQYMEGRHGGSGRFEERDDYEVRPGHSSFRPDLIDTRGLREEHQDRTSSRSGYVDLHPLLRPQQFSSEHLCAPPVSYHAESAHQHRSMRIHGLHRESPYHEAGEIGKGSRGPIDRAYAQDSRRRR